MITGALSKTDRAALIATTVWLPCANLHIRRPLAQRDEAFYPSPVILLVPPRRSS